MIQLLVSPLKYNFCDYVVYFLFPYCHNFQFYRFVLGQCENIPCLSSTLCCATAMAQ